VQSREKKKKNHKIAGSFPSLSNFSEFSLDVYFWRDWSDQETVVQKALFQI
jgi:hypothetical protein